MKKLAVLLLFFILFINPPYSFAAETEVDPFNICGSGATECHVMFDIPTSQIPLSDTETKLWNFDPLGETLPYIKNWFGKVLPNGDYYMSTDRIQRYADQVQLSSDIDLNPAYLQETELHDQVPKKAYTTARLCVTNPQTGEIVGNFVTEQLYNTAEEIPGMRIMTEGNRRLSSFTTRYVQLTQDYNLPDLIVKIDQPPQCGDDFTDTELLEQKGVDSVLENIFGEEVPAIVNFIYTVTADMISLITKTVKLPDGSIEEQEAWQSKLVVPAKYINGLVNSFQGHNLCLGAGCPDTADLEPVKYIGSDDKDALKESGGWINSMYRADAYDPKYKAIRDALHPDQPYKVTWASRETEADTHHYATNRVEAAQTFGNCTLLPASQQQQYFPGGECNENWVEETITLPTSPNTSTWAMSSMDSHNGTNTGFTLDPDFTPQTGNVQTAIQNATTGKIPQCVLEMIGKIEGAYDGASCKPNECGAVGPFQITTGKCTNKCASSACPNALSLYGRGFTAADMCDTNKAAQVAVNLLTTVTGILADKYPDKGFKQITNADPTSQRDAIILAGNSYFGSNYEFRDWGGCSYGEMVYKHCDPTYSCGTYNPLVPGQNGWNEPIR